MLTVYMRYRWTHGNISVKNFDVSSCQIWCDKTRWLPRTIEYISTYIHEFQAIKICTTSSMNIFEASFNKLSLNYTYHLELHARNPLVILLPIFRMGFKFPVLILLMLQQQRMSTWSKADLANFMLLISNRHQVFF